MRGPGKAADSTPPAGSLPTNYSTASHGRSDLRRQVVEQIKPYKEAGATRVILPYVAASDDVVGELKSFIEYWSPLTTGLNES